MHFPSTIIALLSSLTLATATPSPPNAPTAPNAPTVQRVQNLPLSDDNAYGYHMGVANEYRNKAINLAGNDRKFHEVLTEYHHDRATMAGGMLNHRLTLKENPDHIGKASLDIDAHHPHSLEYHQGWFNIHAAAAGRNSMLRQVATATGQPTYFDKHTEGLKENLEQAKAHLTHYRNAATAHSEMPGGKHWLNEHGPQMTWLQDQEREMDRLLGGHGAGAGGSQAPSGHGQEAANQPPPGNGPMQSGH